MNKEEQLEELQKVLEAHGVRHFTAREICSMRKAGNALAIPPKALWLNIIPTLHLADELREMIDEPLRVGNGYRPEDYNRAVGGARKSTHIEFRALDLDLVGSARRDSGFRKFFYEQACELYLDTTPETKMGLGLYSPHGGARVHIDTGRKRRYWKRKYVTPILESLR